MAKQTFRPRTDRINEITFTTQEFLDLLAEAGYQDIPKTPEGFVVIVDTPGGGLVNNLTALGGISVRIAPQVEPKPPTEIGN